MTSQLSLARSPLAISDEAIDQLFRPFAEEVAEADPRWRREMAKRRRQNLKGSLRRLAGSGRRDRGVVEAEDDGSWQATAYEQYAVGAPGPKPVPWTWRDRHFLATDVGGTRFRQLLLIRAIELVRPRSVLEIGCGNGINLLQLAGRFPDLQFSGVELTSGGVRAAQAFQQRHDRLPAALAAFAPEGVRDPAAFRRIEFRQGDAGALPFGDGSFDLVYSVLALEQMETLRERALREMARVAARATFMIEPFADANRSLWRRLYVFRRNYFRGRIDDLPAVGLRPRFAVTDYPQETFLGTAAVLSDRMGRPSP